LALKGLNWYQAFF